SAVGVLPASGGTAAAGEAATHGAPGPVREADPLPARTDAPPPEAPEDRTGGPSPAAPAARTEGPSPAAPPALPTRTRQTSLAPELRAGRQAPARPVERDLDADEMRAVFGAFQRGLDRGRRGVPTGPEEPNHTEEGTHTDDDQ
ncbi:histidine kinase, partial [Streptomyces hyaluromycini]